MEAGGHKGAFNAGEAETNMIGLFSLVPAISDAVNLPVVASGGVADARYCRRLFIRSFCGRNWYGFFEMPGGWYSRSMG